MSFTTPQPSATPKVPVPRINTSLVNSNPQMYAASLAANPTPEEAMYAKNIMGLTNLDEKFSKNPNLTAARKDFYNLDPTIRQGLMYLNPGADYQEKSPSILKTFYQGTLTTLASPFKGIIAVAGEYAKLTNVQYKMVRQFLDTGKSDKEAFEYILSAKNWIDTYQGKNSWDEEADSTLNKKHGSAMGTLVKGIIDGKKPGDIIREYGNLAADGGAMTNAIMAMSNGDDAYKNAYAEYKAYQINPGNDLTNWANSNHPPSDGGVWGAIIPAALAITHPLSILSSMAEGSALYTRDKVADKWLVKNPNPYGKETFISPSGEINAWYQVAIDPLTWLTGGSSRAILASEKLAEQFTKSSQSKGVIQAVADLAENPQWAKRQENLAFTVSALRDARLRGNDVEAGFIRNDITVNFPEVNDELFLKRLVDVRVLNNEEKLVPVTDLDTMVKFYQMGEHTNYIISGKLEGNMFYRENNVLLERRTRQYTDGVKQAYDQVFNGVDRKIISGDKPIPDEVFDTQKAFEDYFAVPIEQRFGQLVMPKTDATLKALGIKQKNIQRSAAELMAKHPANVMLYTADGLAEKSGYALRDYFRLITGDKVQANILVERYLRVSPDERLNMLASMLKLYTDKLGMASIPAGLEKQRVMLEQLLGINRGMGAVPFNVPAHLAKEGTVEIPLGASRITHTTKGISMPNFDAITREIYELHGFHSKLVPHLALNGMTHNVALKNIINTFTFGLLFPKVGIKAAVDDGTQLYMVANPTTLYGMFSGKGSAMHNALMRYTGSDETMGMVKSYMLDKMGVNPAKEITAGQRKSMQERVKIDSDYTLPNGKKIKSGYSMSAEEFYGAAPEERLAEMAMVKLKNRLTPEEMDDFGIHLVNNSHTMEGLAKSTIANSFSDTMIEGSLAAEIFGKSEVTKAAEAYGELGRFSGKPRGLKDTGKYLTDEQNLLTAFDRSVVHHKEYFIAFGKNMWTTPFKTTVDFGSAFIKYDALRTGKQGEAFVDDIMQQIGWSKNSYGKWVAQGKVVKEDKINGDVIISAAKSKESITEFNTLFRQTTELENAGKTAAQISEGLIRNMMHEMYTIFHGSSDGFNDELLGYIKQKMAEQQEKILKRSDWESSDYYMRKYAKAPLDPKSAKYFQEKAAYEATVSSPAYVVRKTPINEFQEVTSKYPLSGEMTTSYDFPNLPITVEGHFKKLGNIGWEMMDRQITDLVRSDAFLLKLLEQRKKMRPDQKQMVEDLVAREVPRGDAELQAKLFFDNRAKDNAVNDLLKYADNPEVRTAFAWNMRGVGRFIRATEDYTRRMMRYMGTHPDKVLYRVSHTSTAMDGTGLVYDDSNGNQYVMVPNDGIMWRTVAPVFAALMNPLKAGLELAQGNWDFFKQPEWNQSTLKISMLNPSYSEGSGLYSLTGPTMAIPVLGVKQLLGLSSNPKLKSLSENLDNWILGPQSDNTDWARATFAGAFSNTWKTFDDSAKNSITASTMYQAAAILQNNPKTALNFNDYGDEKKVVQYLDRLKMAALNIIQVKSGFNTISALPMGSAQPGITPEMRRAGLVTMRQEFSDILRAVLDNNAKYGYSLSDPIGTAVAMFVGNNPDKLVFTVSPNTKSAQLAVSYTQETKKWVINNPKLLRDYSDVAFVFAPHTGKYDPSVVKFLEASDLVKGADNPFDASNAALKNYITSLASVKSRNDYYNIDREVQRLFNDPNNLDRNRPGYRQEVLDNAKSKKADILAGNVALQHALGTASFTTRQSLKERFEHFDQMINDPEHKKALAAGPVYQLVSQIMPATKRVIATFEDLYVRQQPNGQKALDDNLAEWTKRMNKITANNPILAEAYESILKPYVNDLYTIPTAAMNKGN
jgi:hypothetical protein